MKRHRNTNSILFPACLLLAITLLVPLLAATVVRAADVSVKADLNSTEFPEDQTVLLTITVSGARSAEPNMPKADGLQFAYRGQNSQTQWINGKVSSSISFVFIVQAEKAGTHTIEPIKVTVDGKVHMTEPITCTVLPVSATKNLPTARQGTQPQQGMRLRPGCAPAKRKRSVSCVLSL